MDSGIEVLLVEDNMSDAELTIDALKQNNLANKLLHVRDGVAALDFIFGEGEFAGKEIEDNLKVILLDLKMPRINGIQVLQRIRGDERTKSIPMVVLTSSKEDPDIRKCYALGVNSYVVKPVEFDDFQKAISDVGLYWLIVNQHPQ
ncbi:MAG: response regulator [Ferruginibacter sp.]